MTFEKSLRMFSAGAQAVSWRAVDGFRPSVIVLVYYKDTYGRGRITRARYYHDGELENDGMQEEEYAPAGWYETPVEAEHCDALPNEPTHWMPLPSPPPTGVKP